MMVRVAIAAISASFTFNCLADLKEQPTEQMCTLLNDTRLRAGEWITRQYGIEGCASGARLVKEHPGEINRISYAAEGLDGKASRVKLVLNVLSPSTDDAAKRELIRASKRLSVRVLGMSIPHSFDEAIMKGTPIVLEVGSGKTVLTRTAANNQSYVLTVVME
jgi:hypothetical protein